MVPLISHHPIAPDDQIAEVTTYQGALSLHIYARGFLELATVAAHAALDHKTAIDAITPSIIYAIRHATELFLKHMIAQIEEEHEIVAEVTGKNGSMEEAGTNHHNLDRLWREHRSTVVDVLDYEADHAEHAGFERGAWLAEFDGIIDQVHQVDPDGQSLRYPASRRGEPNLEGRMAVSIAQLERFARHAEECFSRFDQRKC